MFISLRPYQRDDDLAVRVGLELVGLLEVLPQRSMVVDLAIDGQGDGFLLVGQGLRPAF